MKKRSLAFLFALIILVSAATAYASSPKPLFKYVKNTLKCLASGDYETIVSSLPVAGIAPDVDEWRKLATRSFKHLSGTSPQTRYAVAYHIGSRWRVAVPISEPSDPSVEVLFLDTEDGKAFCGYGHATWDRIVAEYRSADNVVWNEEYIGSVAYAESDEF